jgi:hypothetical protein
MVSYVDPHPNMSPLPISFCPLFSIAKVAAFSAPIFSLFSHVSDRIEV